MSKWIWVDPNAVIALHELQLTVYGGPPGIRDAGLLESALARPINLSLYGEPDAAVLAASYAYGVARNHSFIDGNKRMGWVTARIFIEANGYCLDFEVDQAIETMFSMAAGELSEDDLAAWFRARLQRSEV